MKVYPVNFTAQKRYNNQNINHKKSQTPLNEGLTTAAGWFGFGFGLDFISRRWGNFTKSPFKNSLILNGIIGSGAGIFTGTKALLSKRND